MKTAVIYARYSSSNQTEQSIEGQVHVCQDFAKRHDIIIVDSYIDRAISGTTDNRDAFQKMLKDSNNKKWDYVLVYKLDRFARNKFESAVNRKHLKDNGVKLLSAMENIPETPEGILLESLLEGMNQYFSEELAQKVSRGQHESRMKGHCIGSVPYGYIKENKMLKINEEESLILQRMFEDYSNGISILQIARNFEKENITKNGEKFHPQTIRKQLKRQIYTGVYEINGKQYNNIYPQIISKELFEKVKTRMNKTKYGCRRPNHETFKLKDKIYCGCCDKKMYPVTAKNYDGSPLRYYKCLTTKKRNCETGNIDKNFIENVIDRFLIEQFNTSKNLEEITNKIYELQKKQLCSNNLLNSLKRDLQKTNTSISNLLSAIEKGIFTTTTKQRLEELEEQKKDLSEKVLIEECKQTFEVSKEDIKTYFQSVMKDCPTSAVKQLIRAIRVYNNKIEVELNSSNTTDEKTIKKVFTETLVSQRQFKGGKIKTRTKTYDIYLII